MAEKNKFLLHICCAGCGAYISQLLKKDYEVILFFYNPCIFPVEEYLKRLEEAKKISQDQNLELIVGDYHHSHWLEKIKGLEKEPEKGKRCLTCFRDRLTETAGQAVKNNIKYFSTTLTVSPHKDASAINKLGLSITKESRIIFLASDFKKNDGFKKAAVLSRKLNIYRQKYCGCEFSKK